jgi:hypothetical protein
MIELKFTIDIRPNIWYAAPCYLEETSLIRSLAILLTLNVSAACRPLFTLSLEGQSLASLFSNRRSLFSIACSFSFPKIPGVAYPFATFSADSRAVTHLPLESTLAKVYQNKQLHLPLESTLMQKPGEGEVIVN